MLDAFIDWVLNGARKATGAFLVALAGAGGTAMLDGNLTGSESVASLGAAIVAAGAVFELANTGKKAPRGQHRAD